MTYTLYDASVPLLLAGLNSLLSILDKAEAYASEKSIDANEILGWRLADDMLPFSFQFHVTTDVSMKIIARVEGTEPQSLSTEFSTVAELRSRVAKALAVVRAADRATFESRTDALVPLGLGPEKGEIQIAARDYLVAYGLPNFFFHIQTAYSILRVRGVQLGKADYLGPFINPFVEAAQKKQ